MSIINQPRQERLSQILSGLLISKKDYENYIFYIISAYAKSGGVDLLKIPIEIFRKKKGRVISIIGVNPLHRITSYEALETLMEICDEVYVFNNEDYLRVFHPKVYVLENDGKNADVFIGSANLTAGGLFHNYEIINRCSYNLRDAVEKEDYKNITNILDIFKNPTSVCCKKLSKELLNKLERLNYIESEKKEEKERYRKFIKISKIQKKEKIFGIEKFPMPPVETLYEKRVGRKRTFIKIDAIDMGFWKKLSGYDVSLTSSPGQIVIPIKFKSYFPPFSSIVFTPKNAQQSDVFFNVIFIDHNGNRIQIKNVRAIHYIPAPSHPRPNEELRFTFRDRKIFSLLERDDILEFKKSVNPDIWFVIRLVKKDISENQRLSRKGKFGLVT